MGRYEETESRWLLPAFMRADGVDDAMADVVDEFGADVYEITRTFSVWDSIDSMDESAIDALAEELNIIWYDKRASVESKRNVVKKSKRLQAKLGTKWALEEILELYFPGNTVVTEWFDYEEGAGEPNHFRIETECFAEVSEASSRFMGVLSKVKRNSAILDKIVAAIGSECPVRAASWLHDSGTVHMKARVSE